MYVRSNVVEPCVYTYYVHHQFTQHCMYIVFSPSQLTCGVIQGKQLYAAEIEKQKVDANQPYADVRSGEFVLLRGRSH